MKFPLTSQQLLGMEERREGDLQLQITLGAFLADGMAQAGVDVRVPTSVWQGNLERLGTALAVTMTIPFAAVGRRSAGSSRVPLGGSQAAYRWRVGQGDRLGSARQALERILAAADWPTISKNDDLQQRSQARRWRAIYKAAFDQESGAQHADEVTKDFRYSRADAEALIGIAGSLLKAVPATVT
ncbi:hypothetical protein GCM10010519_31790 [Streptomyces lactacystinicus]